MQNILHEHMGSYLPQGTLIVVQGAELEKYEEVHSESVLRYYSVVDAYGSGAVER